MADKAFETFLFDRALGIMLVLGLTLCGVALFVLPNLPPITVNGWTMISLGLQPHGPPVLTAIAMALYLVVAVGIYTSRRWAFWLGALFFGAGILSGVQGLPAVLIAIYCLLRLLGKIGSNS